MSLVDLKVNEFINEVDSDRPAPGGGSVAALASSLGIGLTKMVAHLTIGKKKFQGLEDDVKDDYMNHFRFLNELKTQIIPLVDKDTDAFNLIMAAFKMPKETEEDIKSRNEAIENATIEAIKVPLEVARLSLKALETADLMIEHGNKNAISDIGVGALLLYSGLEGAIMNVKINLSGLSNQTAVQEYKQMCLDMSYKGQCIKDHIIQAVNQFID